MEAVNAAVQSVSTSLTASVPTLMGYGLAVGGVILAGGVGWKVFKRFVH